MKFLLIDGDVVKYRVGFAAQKTRYVVYNEVLDPTTGKDPGTIFPNAKEANAHMKEYGGTRESFVEVEPVENALHSCKQLMQSIQDKYPRATVLVYFSCPTKDNWRTVFYPQYKANRKPRRPEHAEAIYEYMGKKFHCLQCTDQEADDAIAAEAAGFRKKNIAHVVCTNDKDMDQIPGEHYDFTKTLEYYVTPDEAALSLDIQTIAGDSTDNIPGIKDWGAVTATKWLENQTVMDAYDKVYECQAVADYQHALNRALVTLPRTPLELRALVREVTDAREKGEALAKAGQDADESVDGAGTGEESSPGVEEKC